LIEGFRELAAFHVTVVFSGIDRASGQWQKISDWTRDLSNIRNYPLLDDAIEWAEDQIIYRNGGDIYAVEMTELSEQALLAGLTAQEIDLLASHGTIRKYGPDERIIRAGDAASSLFFLRSGAVHVKAPHGFRLATITAGMAFGEMALLETHRSADVFADAVVIALEVPLADFERFRKDHPATGERIMRNLALLLADRLISANAKLNLLTST
jgi:glutaminase